MILISIVIGYIVWWIVGNRELLFDPLLQNDDVRAVLFAFHQYDGNPEMAVDPVAVEALKWMTPAVFLLYRVFVPLVHLPIAIKVVQGMSLALLFLAAYIAGRKGNGNIIRMAVLLFFTLHTPSIMLSTAGGLQRAFAIPSIMLWIAGAFIFSRNLRIMAILIAGLTYPVVLGLLLATEFFFGLSTIDWTASNLRNSQFASHLRTTFAIVILSLVILTPSIVQSRSAGGAISFNEAKTDPAFGEGGRYALIPFENPLLDMARYFASPLRPSLFFDIVNHPNSLSRFAFGFAMLALLLLTAFGVWKKKIPLPKTAISLLLGAVGMYLLARVLAFQLYFPDRYIDFGLPLALIAGIAEIIPHLDLQFRQRSISPYMLVSVVIVGALITAGDGIEPKLGVGIDGRIYSSMYEYLGNTSMDTRVACHPIDCDNIPFWTARPSTGGYETILPIFVDSWQRNKTAAEDVLQALYATDWETVNNFTEEYQVSHLLLNEQRYGPDFIEKSVLFEPFDSWLQNKLKTISYKDLVLGAAMDTEAVVYRDYPFVILDVEGLLASQYPER